MKSKVRKAVFPVAGLGTRFLPATKAMPKELLPIIDKPLIQYAAEEAIAAGLDTLIFITGRNKRAIEDHFDGNNELELALRSKGKNEMADMVKNILPEGVECVFVRQKDGTLAGADIHLSDAVRYMVNEVGISQDDAIRMASLIPAQVLGMESEIGCLVPDAQADFLWMKNDLEIEKVWVGGKEQS